MHKKNIRQARSACEADGVIHQMLHNKEMTMAGAARWQLRRHSRNYWRNTKLKPWSMAKILRPNRRARSQRPSSNCGYLRFGTTTRVVYSTLVLRPTCQVELTHHYRHRQCDAQIWRIR
ncbi:UNVERIFIED_CONTAM: hypothetical protein Sradi_1307100 [Sesamum radiatum]|uniref:Uncharacterized protein n=1 Tax=Sesamum radiatum TaxID=300843 RepID=A0AAW2USD6_SESRA